MYTIRTRLKVDCIKAPYHKVWPKLQPSTNTSFFNDCLRASRMVLSDYDKGRIERRMRSMSHAEISLKTGILRRTVSNFISLLKIHHIPKTFYSPDDHE